MSHNMGGPIMLKEDGSKVGYKKLDDISMSNKSND